MRTRVSGEYIRTIFFGDSVAEEETIYYGDSVPEEDMIEVWKNEQGELHREDGPALIYPNGDKVWYKNDEYHRTDGPAVDCSDGEKGWYVNGEEINSYEELKPYHSESEITHLKLKYGAIQ